MRHIFQNSSLDVNSVNIWNVSGALGSPNGKHYIHTNLCVMNEVSSLESYSISVFQYHENKYNSIKYFGANKQSRLFIAFGG